MTSKVYGGAISYNLRECSRRAVPATKRKVIGFRVRFKDMMIRPVSSVVLVGLATLVLLAVGCTESIPSASPLPSPTPTLAPISDANTISDNGQPDFIDLQLGLADTVTDLLSLVPADYETTAFLDVGSILADAELNAVFEDHGGLEVLGPVSTVVQQQIESLVFASTSDNVLAVLRGPLDIQKLLSPLALVGVTPASEQYLKFQILHLEVDTLLLQVGLALSVIDEVTGVLAVDLSRTSSSVEMVETARDTAAGLSPSYFSIPVVTRLIEETPAGEATMINVDCTLFFGEHEGCTGYSVSATRVEEGGVISGVLVFESLEAATSAFPAIQLAVTEGSDALAKLIGPGQVVLEEDLVRFQASVDAGEALSELLELLGR